MYGMGVGVGVWDGVRMGVGISVWDGSRDWCMGLA